MLKSGTFDVNKTNRLFCVYSKILHKALAATNLKIVNKLAICHNVKIVIKL